MAETPIEVTTPFVIVADPEALYVVPSPTGFETITSGAEV